MVSKLNDGKYVQIFQSAIGDVCEFMETIYKKYIHPKISKCSNLPDPDVCPVPSGQYEINNCPADMGEFDQMGDNLGPGNYTAALILAKGDQNLGYITLYSSIVKNPETA